MSLFRSTKNRSDAATNQMEVKQEVMAQNPENIETVQDRKIEKVLDLGVETDAVQQVKFGQSSTIEGVPTRNENNKQLIQRQEEGVKPQLKFKYLWMKSGGTWMKKDEDADHIKTRIFKDMTVMLAKFRQQQVIWIVTVNNGKLKRSCPTLYN
jgi:hypothetical protein